MGGLAFPSLDAAIAKIEGYGTPGTIATNQNNPGNLISGPFSAGYGGTPTVGNSQATFPTFAQGLAAEDALIQHYANNGATLQDMMTAWAPGSIPGNNPTSYAQSVAAATGGSPGAPLTAWQQAQANILGLLLGNNGTGPVGAVASGATAASSRTIWGLLISRVAAFILGFICIAGAIFLFKPTQEVVGMAARRVGY